MLLNDLMNPGTCLLYTSKSTSAEITDESLIPEDYLVPQPPKVDKRGILADLRAGLDVPGAVLSENQNIQIK